MPYSSMRLPTRVGISNAGERLIRRLRVLLPGATLVGLAGVLLAALSANSFLRGVAPTQVAYFFAHVLMAPLFLLTIWSSEGSSFPTGTLVLAAAAIGATPAHLFIASRIARGVTIVGLVVWLLCEVIVAGAPA
jgi:hypothetical protein